MRRGNMEEAEKNAALAVEGDPEQAEYVALYADLISQKPERTKDGNFADLVKMVNSAKEREPANLRVRLYRARVLKRSGDAVGAHREFERIVEQDAHNVEAAREVRLHEMLQGQERTDPEDDAVAKPRATGRAPGKTKPGAKGKVWKVPRPGLFGKLFKR